MVIGDLNIGKVTANEGHIALCICNQYEAVTAPFPQFIESKVVTDLRYRYEDITVAV